LLKQPQYSPYPLPEMTLSLWLGTTGRLDAVPTDDVLRFEQEFLDYVRHHDKALMDSIAETLKFDDDQEAKATADYESFLGQFETSEGKSIKVGHEAEVEPTTDEELGQETIVKQKRG
ncbi:MAG TPA: F0F1 ATP synthase subunit alpha, partial [Marmoricola sp.]